MRRIHVGILLILFAVLSVTCFALGHEETIMTKERQLWKAFKNKDAKTFGQWIAEDVQEISMTDARLRTKADIIQMMSQYNITDYELTDMQVSDITPNVAILTYKVRAKGTHMGKPIPGGQTYASTVWVEKNGDWWAKFHQETPIQSAAK